MAEVARGGGAARVLGSKSFLDAGTGTRHHLLDVQGEAEAMLFLVSVRVLGTSCCLLLCRKTPLHQRHVLMAPRTCM